MVGNEVHGIVVGVLFLFLDFQSLYLLNQIHKGFAHVLESRNVHLRASLWMIVKKMIFLFFCLYLNRLYDGLG